MGLMKNFSLYFLSSSKSLLGLKLKKKNFSIGNSEAHTACFVSPRVVENSLIPTGKNQNQIFTLSMIFLDMRLETTAGVLRIAEKVFR